MGQCLSIYLLIFLIKDSLVKKKQQHTHKQKGIKLFQREAKLQNENSNQSKDN